MRAMSWTAFYFVSHDFDEFQVNTIISDSGRCICEYIRFIHYGLKCYITIQETNMSGVMLTANNLDSIHTLIS